MKDLHRLTATEIVQAIQDGKSTCEAVARACLAHIEERESDVQARQYLDWGASENLDSRDVAVNARPLSAFRIKPD